MHILHLSTSLRGAESFSARLGQGIIDNLLATHADGTVTVRDLAHAPLPYLNADSLQAFFTPAEHRTPGQQALVRPSDEAIAEVLAADVLVIDAPMYNFTIPATLKTWLDYITRAGVTFGYTAAGPEGLVIGKRVYVAMSSGWVYSAGPMQAFDFNAPYLEKILGFLGMTDVRIVRAEGTMVPDQKETALEKALASVPALTGELV